MRDHLVSRLRAAGCVFAEEEADLLIAQSSPDQIEQRVLRRIAGEPLEQIVGWAEFCGLRVKVVPGVFVPRRRSEHLVSVCRELLNAGDVVIELCAGTGAISMALLALPELSLRVFASDIDPVAVNAARSNLPTATVLLGDLYAPLPRELKGRARLVVANAPYVPTSELAHLPTEARVHEPATALDGGADGAGLQRRIIASATEWLVPGGHVVIETGRDQSGITASSMREHGLLPRVSTDDARDATAVVGSFGV